MATEPGGNDESRDKPGDCQCGYPGWRFYSVTEHAPYCPAHERICREQASRPTPFPVGSRVRIGHGPEAKLEGLVLGVAGHERWVQVGHETFIYNIVSLYSDGPEPDPPADVAAIATGGAGRGRARSR